MVRQPFRGLAASTSGKRRAALFPLSVVLHAAGGGALLLLSAVGPADLPPVVGRITDFMPPALVRAAPPSTDRPRPLVRGRSRGGTPVAPAIAPTIVVPDGMPLVDTPIDDDPPPLCLTNCGTSGVDGAPNDGSELIGDGPPDGPGMGGSTAPVRPGGDIREPRRIHYVAPAYPEIARQGRIGAIVILDCVLDPQGKIASVHVLRGHPLFDAAAIDAVRQWRYEATRLNGVPVAVQLTVTVRFIPRS